MNPASKAIHTCLILLVIMVFSSALLADDSFEYNGYFRAGVTSNLDGGTGNGGQCYSLTSHPKNDGLYYRLGNECRDYGEVQFTKKKSYDGIDFKGVVMLDVAGSNENSTATTSWSRRERQLYLEATGAFENATTLWVGRRYYRSAAVGDVHIIDAFHVNSSGNGFGFSDIPIGGDNKLHLAFIAQGDDSDQQNQVIDARTDFGMGSVGRIKIALQQLINNEVEGVDAIDGNTLTLQWNKNIGGIFDQKTVAQFGSDAFANNPGCFGTDGIGNSNCYNTNPNQEGLEGTRIFNNGMWDISDTVKINTMLMIEDIDETREVTSIGIRPHMQLSPHWSVLGELGINEVEPEGGDKEELQKITLALQLTGNAGNFWERPAIRFFVSKFDWNNAAATGSSLSVAGQPDQTDATIWGVQAEFWF